MRAAELLCRLDAYETEPRRFRSSNIRVARTGKSRLGFGAG